MRPWIAIVLILMVGFPAPVARARSESKLHAYAREHVWSTAIRFLAVDERAKIVDKDEVAGYVLFELGDDKQTYRGSLEVITLELDGQASIRFVVNLMGRPQWMEIAMLARLERKVRAELGMPAPPRSRPKEPPPEPEPPKDREPVKP